MLPLLKEAFYLSITTIITFLLFSSTMGHYMVVSDAIWLKDGVTFRWSNFFGMNSHGMLRPVVVVYFYYAYKLFGFHLSGYYFANIVMHLADAFILYVITRKLCRAYTRHYREAAFLSALFFAVLFSHYQALVVFCNIHDTLLTFFCLLSLYLLLCHDEKSNVVFYGLSVLCYALAQLCKEPAISYPFVLFSALVLFHKPLEWGINFKRSMRLLIPHFAVLVVFLAYYGGVVLPAQNKEFPRLVIGTPLDFLMLNLDSLFDLFISAFGVVRDVYFSYYISRLPLWSLWFNLSRFLLFAALAAMLLLPFAAPNRSSRADAYRLISFCLIWILFNFVPSTISLEAGWKNFVFIPRFRYAYLPSAGIAMLVAVFVVMVYEMMEPFWWKTLRAAVVFTFIISFTASNYISTVAMIYGYRVVKLNYKNLVDSIGAACHKNCSRKFVVFVNFPEGYKYFYLGGIKPAIDLFFQGAEKIFWASAAEINSAAFREKADIRKSIFVEFNTEDNSIRDGTEFYTKWLLQKK